MGYKYRMSKMNIELYDDYDYDYDYEYYADEFIFDRKNDLVSQDVMYFSYREEFVPLSNGMTNDIGWGCMVRTGQMMLYETLKRNKKFCLKNGNIDILFYDIPTSPFSIHRFTQFGEIHNIPVGSWFSPSSLIITLKDLVTNSPANDYLKVIASSNTIYKKKIREELKNRECLLLISVMVGVGYVSEVYNDQITKCLEHYTTVGIIGGKPRKSLYFIGSHDDKLIYLDPHMVKKAFVDNQTHFQDNKFVGSTEIAYMDPCMILCFYFKNEKDLLNLESFVKTNFKDNDILFGFREEEIQTKVKAVDDGEWVGIISDD
jgi:cysteine protease ATG4